MSSERGGGWGGAALESLHGTDNTDPTLVMVTVSVFIQRKERVSFFDKFN